MYIKISKLITSIIFTNFVIAWKFYSITIFLETSRIFNFFLYLLLFFENLNHFHSFWLQRGKPFTPGPVPGMEVTRDTDLGPIKNGWSGGEMCLFLGFKAYHIKNKMPSTEIRGSCGENAFKIEEQRRSSKKI